MSALPAPKRAETARLAGLSKAERLLIAGAVAPAVRRATDGDRRIAIVDAAGKIVGYRTLADVRKSLLERAKIEIDTGDGVRPKTVVCERCGRLVKVGSRSSVKRVCREGCAIVCAGAHGKACPEGAPAPAHAFNRRMVASRQGAPWRCAACAASHYANRRGKGRVDRQRSGRWAARLPHYLGHKSIGGTFATKAEARAALDARIAEIRRAQNE